MLNTSGTPVRFSHANFTAAVIVLAANFLVVQAGFAQSSPIKQADQSFGKTGLTTALHLRLSQKFGGLPNPVLPVDAIATTGVFVNAGCFGRAMPALSQAVESSSPTRSAPSLYQIVEHAKLKNPDIARAMTQIRKAKADLSTSDSAYGPIVRLGASEGIRSGPQGAARGANIQVSKLLHDFGKSDNLISEARMLEAAKVQEHIETVNRVVLDITETYLNLLRQVSLQKIHSDSEIALDQSAQIIRLRVEAGLNPAGDAHIAQARLEQVRAARVAASVQHEQLLSRLMTLSGLSLPDVGRNLPAALTRKGPEEGSWRSAEAASVRQAEAEYQAAIHRMRSVRASRFPSISLDAGRNTGNASGQSSAANFVNVTLNLDVLNAGIPSKIESAAADAEAAELKIVSALQAVEDSVRRSRAELRGIEARQPLMMAQSRSTAATQENFMEQFLAGRKQVLDILNTHQEVLAIEGALAGLKFDRMIQIARLYSLQGTLFDLLSTAAEDSIDGISCRSNRLTTANLSDGSPNPPTNVGR